MMRRNMRLVEISIACISALFLLLGNYAPAEVIQIKPRPQVCRRGSHCNYPAFAGGDAPATKGNGGSLSYKKERHIYNTLNESVIRAGIPLNQVLCISSSF